MFRKLFAGFAAAGVLAGVLATGAFAASAGATAATPPTKHQDARRDLFAGTVTAINEKQLTVRNRKGDSKTFLRIDKTQVFRGRNERASWSEIEVNSHVAVKYEMRDGKLYARRIHIGLAQVRGKVKNVDGSLITIATRDGKDVKVVVNADTKYIEGRAKTERKAGSLSDVHAGDPLVAAGKWDANGSFDAVTILFWDKATR